ncbi:DegV family protein [Sinomonas sp. ASV322]|uniref:DegV family protein n=1 Tax=Sinomonas sp. ASV322 TaxID=3041920 RepID=UPI0027DC399F|nr:DegV family protein [Sinomonas sp. ASV322]MDQ4501116.1 DegV family protein [Sinomonas sp. ASV322]
MVERSAAGWLAGRFLGERLSRLRLPERREPPAPAVRTAVVTDSAAALPVEWTESAGKAAWFEVVPLSVMAGDDIFSDGPEAEAALAIALAEGRPVKTSRPAPGVFERVYRRLGEAGYEAIVSIHLSGALSGTVDAARLAAERVDFPVHVLDTRMAGLAEGFAVRAAANAAAAGADAEAVAGAARDALEGAQVRFFLPSLEQLRRGGRIGAAASWVGTVLAIKPLLAIRDGQIIPIDRIRTSARAIPHLRELSLDDARRRSEPKLAVHYFGNRPEAESLARELAETLANGVEVIVSPLPAVLAAHTGLGVLAIVVTGRETPAVTSPSGAL